MKKKLGGIGTRSLIVILAVLVLVIIGLVIGIIIRINSNNNQNNIANGDISKFIDEIDRKIAQANSVEEKASLYVEKINTVYDKSNGELSEEDIRMLISDAYILEKIEPSVNSAYTVYLMEQELGDESKAKIYYDLYQQRANEEKNNQGSNINGGG